jgi:hypothetical protein
MTRIERLHGRMNDVIDCERSGRRGETVMNHSAAVILHSGCELQTWT